MDPLRPAAEEFLSQRRIAVAGVARGGDTAANVIYRKLRDTGYEVFAVNPNADQVEGDPCWRSLADIPCGVDGVVIGTTPAASLAVARECVALGVPRVWFHRLLGQGSVLEEAVELCRRSGAVVIAGACPMMYAEPVDPAHRCFRWLLGVTGRLPEPTGAGISDRPPAR